MTRLNLPNNKRPVPSVRALQSWTMADLTPLGNSTIARRGSSQTLAVAPSSITWVQQQQPSPHPSKTAEVA